MIDELVSIVMPSYNTGDYIAESVRSVLRQTYTNWELLIADDCSTDNTLEILQTFDDPRIFFLQNIEHSGAAVTRNYALRKAKEKWIAFLDSDDQWRPEKLEKQISFMLQNDYHFSYTNYSEISTDGTEKRITISGPKRVTRTGFYNYCWPGCLTVMYDAEYVGLIQISDIKKNNDYAMWLEVSRRADCYLLSEDLAIYRRGRSGSISTHSTLSMLRWHYELYRRIEGQNTIEATMSTARNDFFGICKKLLYVKCS